MLRTIHRRLTERLFRLLWNRVASRRPADFIVGADDPYLSRWHLLPRNPLLNIYLHEITRSDDDRALHDHPWCSLSWCLHGSMVEHTIEYGGVHKRRVIEAGDLRLRSARLAHRLEIGSLFGVCWTLFFTGPVYREWGFHCQSAWVPHDRFVGRNDEGSIGAGCGAEPRAPRPFWRVFSARDA